MNERILAKLSEAMDSADVVKEYLPDTFEGFLAMSRLERDGIYKNIEFAIQNILDMCAMILKDKKLRVPNSDDMMFDLLEEAGVMDSVVMEAIREMKGFRNQLVHRYGLLEDSIAYEDIKTRLQDFQTIFEAIKQAMMS